MDGKVVYLTIYDVGGTIDLKKLKKHTAKNSAPGRVIAQSSIPDYIQFPPYYQFNSPSQMVDLPIGTVELVPRIKIFSIGVVAISVNIDFQNCSLDDLRQYYKLNISTGKPRKRLDAYFQTVFKPIAEELEPSLTEIYDVPVAPEKYTVFCVHNSDGIAPDAFQSTCRKELAALLTNTKSKITLSDKEVNDILSSWFSYTENDLVVIDWDSAFILDPAREFEDPLLVFEIGNLILLELRAVDSYLNIILDDAYRDIDLFFAKKLKYATAKEALRDIIDTKIDVLKMTDELTNTTNFVGEWFLAKLFKACAEKFHLDDWEKSVGKKLSTLSELYLVLNNALEQRKLLILEYSIVLLFVIDVLLVVLFFVLTQQMV